MISAVRFHHRPSAAGKHQRAAACVYLGNSIAHFTGYGSGHNSLSTAGRDEALQCLNLSATQMPRLMSECLDRFQQVKGLYNLGA